MRLVLVGAAMCLPLMACAEENLVSNPGFEQGAERWGLINNWYAPEGKQASPGVIDDAAAHSGRASLRIDGQGSRGLAIQSPVPVEAGQKYRLSCWMRGESMGEVRAGPLIEFWSEEQGHLGGKFIAREVPAQWERLSEVTYAPVGSDYAKIMCATQTENEGRVWFDDVGVSAAVPPPPVHPELADDTLVWEDYEAPPSVAYYRVYASEQPFESVALMTAAEWLPADSRSLSMARVGADAQWVAVVAVDEDDMENPRVEPVEVRPQ
ncbi:MAG: carbohydrate binding domain-containing protein [Armatimonadota bacterium]|nr:carbohydrate binding domain-containing protein [Armatimonadota bacterium]